MMQLSSGVLAHHARLYIQSPAKKRTDNHVERFQVAQASLKLATSFKPTVNSDPPYCLCLPNPEITGVCPHTWF